MSEIVYTETIKNRLPLDTLEYGETVTDTKETIFASRDKVALVRSVMVVGVPRGDAHKNKRYYKWRTVGSMGFFRNRGGYPQPYRAARPWNFNRQTPWRHGRATEVFELLNPEDYSTRAQNFREQCWSAFGFESLREFYPVAGMYGLDNYDHLPYGLRPAMREDNWEDYVIKAFGKTRNSPRLVAAVGNTEPYIVALAQQFRGLVPNEDVVSFIENNKFDDEMMEGFEVHSPNVRAWVMHLDPNARIALLKRGIDLGDTHRIRELAMRKNMLSHRNFKERRLATSWSEVLGR